jgi:hypothetical protein
MVDSLHKFHRSFSVSFVHRRGTGDGANSLEKSHVVTLLTTLKQRH